MRCCVNCGKELRNYQTKYCSPECAEDYCSKFPETVTIPKTARGYCVNCGKKLRKNQTLYCSQECAWIYRRSNISDGYKSEFEVNFGKDRSKYMLSLYKDDEWKKMHYKSIHRGKDHYAWKGGVSFGPYCQKFTREFRDRVRFFWGYVCGNPECGKTQEENGQKLSVHHVHFDKQVCCNDRPAMFVPLCRSCHTKTNNNEEKYIKIYEDLIINKFNGKSYYTKEEYLKLIC